jgi:hypothetical protein
VNTRDFGAAFKKLSQDRVRPNKRLKLTGGYRFKGSGVFARWRAPAHVEGQLRARASRPQLKRDSLGDI